MTKIDRLNEIESLKENIAAITATFCQDNRYQTFYSNNCDAISGCVGVWRYCVDAAEAFTAVEHGLHVHWDGEWIDAVDKFCDAMHEAAAPVADRNPSLELTRMAWSCIKSALKLH